MTPKDYLSYSQMRLWQTSPKAYVEKYVYGKANFTNRAMAFGKSVSTALEEGDMTGDMGLDILLLDLPRFENMEYPLKSILKQGKEEVPLYSQLDSAKTDLTGFKEYKTGVTNWTQRKVDEDPQITFYATSIYIKTGKIPTDMELVHIVTEQDHETLKISATGAMHRFPTKRTTLQVLKCMVEIRKVWKEISEMYEKEIV